MLSFGLGFNEQDIIHALLGKSPAPGQRAVCSVSPVVCEEGTRENPIEIKDDMDEDASTIPIISYGTYTNPIEIEDDSGDEDTSLL